MITLPIWQVFALAFVVAGVGFIAGVTLMASMVAAGRADDAYEADRRMFGDGDALTAGLRGDEEGV